MTYKLFCLLCALGLSAHPVFGQSPQTALAYPMPPVEIDGDLTDWPTEAMRYPIENMAFGDISDASDLQASFRVGYNLEAASLYIGIEVVDAEHIGADDQGNMDETDYVYLYLDPVHSPYGGSTLLFMAGESLRDFAAQPQEWNPYMPNLTWDSVALKVKRAQTTTIYEWSLPLGDAIAANRVLGFDLIIGDNDPTDEGSTWLTWRAGTSKSHSSIRLGEIILAESLEKVGWVEGQVEIQDPRIAQYEAIKFESEKDPNLWFRAAVDSSGQYQIQVPTGQYTITPFQTFTSWMGSWEFNQDSRKIHADQRLTVEVHPKSKAHPETITLKTQPPPLDLFEDEGLLFQDEFSTYKMDRFIRAFQAYLDIPGVSVALIKDNQVVYDKVFGVENTLTGQPLRKDALFEGASITKSVFAVMALRLAERGLLDLDKPIHEYLSFPNITHDERHTLITARHVLNHQSGLDNWPVGAYTGFLSDVEAELHFDPGTEFMYSGEAMNYLGRVIEHLTQKPLSQVFQEEIAEPFGLKNTYFSYTEDQIGHVSVGHFHQYPRYKAKFPRVDSPASSLHSTASDFSKFMVGLLKEDHLSPASYELIQNPHHIIPPEKTIYDPDLTQGMGHGFFIVETPQGKVIGHGGNNLDFECKYGILPGKGIGYVVFTNSSLGDEFIRYLELYVLRGRTSIQG